MTKSITIISTIFILSILIFTACEEIEIPIISDEDEIEDYVEFSFDAQMLYRTDNLILTQQVFISDDSSKYYFDKVDSTKREIDIYNVTKDPSVIGSAVQPLVDLGPPHGPTEDAEVTIKDMIYLKRTIVSDSDSSFIDTVLSITRYAYFQKLGDDEQSYRGWLLRGYNNGDTLGLPVSVLHQNNSPFSQNYHSIVRDVVDEGTSPVAIIAEDLATRRPYLDLNRGDYEIERVASNEKINFSFPAMPPALIHSDYSVTGKIVTGYQQKQLVINGSMYTADIIVPSSSQSTWDFFFIQNNQLLIHTDSLGADTSFAFGCTFVPFFVE